MQKFTQLTDADLPITIARSIGFPTQPLQKNVGKDAVVLIPFDRQLVVSAGGECGASGACMSRPIAAFSSRFCDPREAVAKGLAVLRLTYVPA
jgi:hypothetical protein